MKTLVGATLLFILGEAAAGGRVEGARPAPSQEKTAKELLEGSLKEAKEKNRRVLLTFGSPG